MGTLIHKKKLFMKGYVGVGWFTVEVVVEPGVVGLREGDDELACHRPGHAHT